MTADWGLGYTNRTDEFWYTYVNSVWLEIYPVLWVLFFLSLSFDPSDLHVLYFEFVRSGGRIYRDAAQTDPNFSYAV